MKKILSLTLLLLLTFNCSSDDDNESDAVTLNSINQTEWKHTENNRTYHIYFSVDNGMTIQHPVYNVNTGNFDYILIQGSFIYNKPNVEIMFTGECTNNGFVFSSCNVNGTISSDSLIVSDNGTDYTFSRNY